MDCECYGGNCMSRVFLTKSEKLSRLKQYKEALDKESQGVAESINKLEFEN